MTEPRYRPIERLAAGGMAEVFIAEATSVQGFKKRVAIKRVLPHLAQNKNFIGMFLDEARLGARMTHANCVTVFDIGAADNTYFIVMEFVDGCDLKTVIEYFRKKDQPVPVKEAMYIAMEACRGLQYAHELTDDDGDELHIVHRDISPPNILISKRGEVKVTDFGLAKASTQLEKTDPGVVKGKFAYLAPEAVGGEEVDARADVFAMAIVLWEMIANRRLFLGENDYQTVKLVQAANVPPLSTINPTADAQLDAIMATALARDPAKRYQSAREFGDALAGYLFGKQLKVTSYDIATMVKEAIADAAASKPKQSVAASIIDKLIQEELLAFTSIDNHTDAMFSTASGGPEGSKPLDAGQFVNPASWFDDDDLGSVLGEDGESGWKESGLDDSSDQIPSLTAAAAQGAQSVRAPASSSGASTTESGSGPSELASAAGAQAAGASASQGGAGKWAAVALVVLVVAGAAAAVLLK